MDFTIEPRMVSLFDHILQSHRNTRVFWVSIINYKPGYIPLKYRCFIKKSKHIRLITYLRERVDRNDEGESTTMVLRSKSKHPRFCRNIRFVSKLSEITLIIEYIFNTTCLPRETECSELYLKCTPYDHFHDGYPQNTAIEVNISQHTCDVYLACGTYLMSFPVHHNLSITHMRGLVLFGEVANDNLQRILKSIPT